MKLLYALTTLCLAGSILANPFKISSQSAKSLIRSKRANTGTKENPGYEETSKRPSYVQECLNDVGGCSSQEYAEIMRANNPNNQQRFRWAFDKTQKKYEKVEKKRPPQAQADAGPDGKPVKADDLAEDDYYAIGFI